MTLADDQAQLIQALVRNGVEFVVVKSKEASGREKDHAALPGMRQDFGLDD